VSQIQNLCGYRVFFDEKTGENIQQLSDNNLLVDDVRKGLTCDKIAMDIEELLEIFQEGGMEPDSAMHTLFKLVLSLQKHGTIAVNHQDKHMSFAIALLVSQVSELVALTPDAKTIFHFASEAELVFEAESRDNGCWF